MNPNQPTRAENIKRAIADGGRASEATKDHFANRNHAYGLNQTPFEGLEGEPWRPSKDPTHNCEQNGCRGGNHYLKPTGMRLEAHDGEA
jgi:hypothetical protein